MSTGQLTWRDTYCQIVLTIHRNNFGSDGCRMECHRSLSDPDCAGLVNSGLGGCQSHVSRPSQWALLWANTRPPYQNESQTKAKLDGEIGSPGKDNHLTDNSQIQDI